MVADQSTHCAMRAEQKTCMRNKVKPDGFARNVNIVAGLLNVLNARRLCQGNTMTGRAGQFLRENGHGERRNDGEDDKGSDHIKMVAVWIALPSTILMI